MIVVKRTFFAAASPAAPHRPLRGSRGGLARPVRGRLGGDLATCRGPCISRRDRESSAIATDFPWSRLGDLNPGPTHYELTTTPLRSLVHEGSRAAADRLRPGKRQPFRFNRGLRISAVDGRDRTTKPVAQLALDHWISQFFLHSALHWSTQHLSFPNTDPPRFSSPTPLAHAVGDQGASASRSAATIARTTRDWLGRWSTSDIHRLVPTRAERSTPV